MPEQYSPSSEKSAAEKIACNACLVLCQISDVRSGACDRYANQAGAVIRVDPVVFLRRTLADCDARLVPFSSDKLWDGQLAKSNEVFVTGVGSTTTFLFQTVSGSLKTRFGYSYAGFLLPHAVSPSTSSARWAFVWTNGLNGGRSWLYAC